MRLPVRVLPLPRVARDQGRPVRRRRDPARAARGRRGARRSRRRSSSAGGGVRRRVRRRQRHQASRSTRCRAASSGCALDDLDVDVSWFGTGIRRIPSAKPAPHGDVPPLILSMMPLGRAASDDARSRARTTPTRSRSAAEEAEEAALEATRTTTTEPPIRRPPRPAGARARAPRRDARAQALHERPLGERVPAGASEAGFEPLGLVMGTSIYQIAPPMPIARSAGLRARRDDEGALPRARARDDRMEEEADALGADGIVGVRLDVNLR